MLHASPARSTVVRAVLVLLAVELALTVVVSLSWLASAPKTRSFVIPLDGGTFVIPAENESWVAGDGRFVMLSLAAGFVVAVVAYALRSLRGPVGVAVVAAGSLAASALASVVGQTLSHGPTTAPLRTAFTPPLHLHAQASLLVWGLTATVIYTLIAGLSTDENLGVRPSTAPPEELPHSPEPRVAPAAE